MMACIVYNLSIPRKSFGLEIELMVTVVLTESLNVHVTNLVIFGPNYH